MVEEKNKETKTWLSWMGPNETANVFFAMTFLVVVVTVFAFCRSNSIFKENQDKIVKNQTAQIESVKSVLTVIHNNANKAFVINGDRIQQLISDSVLARIPDLNNTQQAILNKYIKAVITASSSELAYKDWIKEINTTLTQKQISQIQQESKSLLELEFNKIQSEYQGLLLWAGILTIVFLIFSFYSLFRADDLVKQGREGLAEIGVIKKESQTTIQKTEEAHTSIQSKIIQSEQAIEKIEQSRTSMESAISEINGKLESTMEKFAEIVAIQKQLDSFRDDLAAVEERIKLFNVDMDENESRIDELNNKLPNVITYSSQEIKGTKIFDSEEEIEEKEGDNKETESGIDDSIK